MEQLNLIVVKWGNLYGAEFVVNLYNNAKQYSSKPFNFYVFTDDTQDLPTNLGWHFINLPNWNMPLQKAWFYKIEIFNSQHNLQGRNLYIDLDTIIIGDLTPFWLALDDQHLAISRDFNRVYISDYKKCNSSVMGWTNHNLASVYHTFVKDTAQYSSRYRGDQDFLEVHANPKKFFEDSWAMSWKWECWRGGKKSPTDYKLTKDATVIDPNTKILVFHGKPNPNECEDSKMIELWKGAVKHK